jgi:hypothetical protein
LVRKRSSVQFRSWAPMDKLIEKAPPVSWSVVKDINFMIFNSQEVSLIGVKELFILKIRRVSDVEAEV